MKLKILSTNETKNIRGQSNNVEAVLKIQMKK